MRDLLNKIFKDKFNIILFFVEILAVCLLIFSILSNVCLYAFLFLQAVFFILLGIKILKNNKKIMNQKQILELLPYSKDELELISKKSLLQIKNNKFKGVMIIFIGVFLIITILTMLF